MFDLKPIHREAIPEALEKAERYRLLNEPREAESICRDILRVDAENEEALVLLLLALTDQFDKGLRVNVNHAEEAVHRLKGEYERAYYHGVILERWAKTQMEEGAPGYVAFERFCQAMKWFEKAEKLSPEGNDDAILRWNTCARIIKRNDQLGLLTSEHDACALASLNSANVRFWLIADSFQRAK